LGKLRAAKIFGRPWRADRRGSFLTGDIAEKWAEELIPPRAPRFIQRPASDSQKLQVPQQDNRASPNNR